MSKKILAKNKEKCYETRSPIRSSNKQSEESLRGDRPLSTNRFTRRHTYELSTTRSNVRFEEEARRSSIDTGYRSEYVYVIHKEENGGGECSKIRLPLTKKISSRKCYCGKIFEHRFVLDLMCTKGGKMKEIVRLGDGSFLLEGRNLGKGKITKVMEFGYFSICCVFINF